ncbi:MAG: hypothetical protein ACI8P9_005557 [Parasphingorhabdus sp.]|jgi:hypothetical protein
MNATDYLGQYAEGWTNGDANTILNAVSDNYLFDDPNAGKFTKHTFPEYLESMKDTARSLLNDKLPQPFLAISEVVTQEAEGEITAWVWWTVPGTEIKGGGLIKVGAEGVHSEVITYYAKLPD